MTLNSSLLSLDQEAFISRLFQSANNGRGAGRDLVGTLLKTEKSTLIT